VSHQDIGSSSNISLQVTENDSVLGGYELEMGPSMCGEWGLANAAGMADSNAGFSNTRMHHLNAALGHACIPPASPLPPVHRMTADTSCRPWLCAQLDAAAILSQPPHTAGKTPAREQASEYAARAEADAAADASAEQPPEAVHGGDSLSLLETQQPPAAAAPAASDAVDAAAVALRDAAAVEVGCEAVEASLAGPTAQQPDGADDDDGASSNASPAARSQEAFVQMPADAEAGAAADAAIHAAGGSEATSEAVQDSRGVVLEATPAGEEQPEDSTAPVLVAMDMPELPPSHQQQQQQEEQQWAGSAVAPDAGAGGDWLAQSSADAEAEQQEDGTAPGVLCWCVCRAGLSGWLCAAAWQSLCVRPRAQLLRAAEPATLLCAAAPLTAGDELPVPDTATPCPAGSWGSAGGVPQAAGGDDSSDSSIKAAALAATAQESARLAATHQASAPEGLRDYDSSDSFASKPAAWPQGSGAGPSVEAAPGVDSGRPETKLIATLSATTVDMDARIDDASKPVLEVVAAPGRIEPLNDYGGAQQPGEARAGLPVVLEALLTATTAAGAFSSLNDASAPFAAATAAAAETEDRGEE
jgi:hypothetical protein